MQKNTEHTNYVKDEALICMDNIKDLVILIDRILNMMNNPMQCRKDLQKFGLCNRVCS